MRKSVCVQCGSSNPLGEMYEITQGLNQNLFCKPCADQIVAGSSKANKTIVRAVSDPTICALCKTDFGNMELPATGSLHLCEICREKALNRPFPSWLRISFVVLLALLVIALVSGRRYFRAERSLARGEYLLEQKQYAAAAPLLSEALKIVPAAQKPILLTAKACLLSGDFDSAVKALNGRKQYNDNSLFKEVNGIYERANAALIKAAKAIDLEKQRKWQEAAKTMRQAASEYSEMPQLADLANSCEISVAFYDRDFDRMLVLTEKWMERDPNNPAVTAGVAGALACKYAVSGDAELLQKAERMIEKSSNLCRSADQKADYEEYAERLRHRLKTREIIDKAEYDRRFRPDRAESKR